MFDHARLEAMAAAMGDLSRPFDRRLASVPFAHTGFMGRVWDTVANAICEVIVPTPWKAAEALRLIEAERVTVCQGVPTQWSLLLAEPGLDDLDLSSLRATSVGAAAASPTLVAEMHERMGCPVLVGYASTETGTISRPRLDDPLEVALTTVGRAEHGVELAVVDAYDRPVPDGEVGAVRCRSAGSMIGYWDDAATTAEALGDDGWVRTGDLGWLDERGNLHLAGRTKEMYIRGGYNVYPSEVESAVAAHPAVAAVAVVAAADPVLGEVGVAFVSLRPSASADEDELRSWCRERLADYKAPDLVRFVDELPVTPVGKVDKRELADRVGDAAEELARRRDRTRAAESAVRSNDDA
jgi:acyl-CoA synthetase (AMP-forming)/AMP-acid ligase II